MSRQSAQVRKQLVLGRIALERSDWIRDVDALRRQLTPAALLSGWLQGAAGGGWVSALFGLRGERAGSATSPVGRILAIALMLRRHPLWWPLIAGVLPWLRAHRSAPPSRRGWARVLLTGLGAAGVAALWWFSRRPGSRPPR